MTAALATGLSRQSRPTGQVYYVAFYEDADKVEAAAGARGFTGADGESWHDFVEAEQDKFRAARRFTTLPAAEGWLKAELGACKSVYGVGSILLMEVMDARCRACVCGGRQARTEWRVDDTGIVETEELDNQCL